MLISFNGFRWNTDHILRIDEMVKQTGSYHYFDVWFVDGTEERVSSPNREPIDDLHFRISEAFDQ